MDLIVNVSSLYPIDITAALARLVNEEREDLLIAINDGALVRGKAEHRVHIARQAIATCQWDYGADRTWRLKHEAMETEDGDRTIEALSALVSDIEKSVGHYSSRLASEARYRGNRVIGAIASESKAPPKTWIANTTAIVHRIFTDCGLSSVSVRPYSELFEDLRARGVVTQFLERLVLESSSAGRQIVFLRGGYIEINDNNGHVRRFKGIDGTIDRGTKLILVCGDRETVQIPIHKVVEDPVLRIGGPLELALLAGCFELVDFPWFTYGRVVGASDHREYISPPIVVQDSRAGSRWGGGERLSPSGYSLLDFGSEPRVCALVAGLLGSKMPNAASLNVWAKLLERIPPARQKAAKSQTIAHALRHELESDATSLLWQCTLETNSEWSTQERSPFTLTDDLIGVLAIMHCLRRVSFMHGENIPVGIRKLVGRMGLVTGDMVNIDRFNTIVGGVLDDALYWLEKWGVPAEDCRALRETCSRLMAEQSEKLWVLYEGPRSGMGQLTKAFQQVTDAYLEFVVFFGTSVVKSHILLLYLLLGPKTLRRVFHDLEVRRTVAYVGFQPVVYEFL